MQVCLAKIWLFLKQISDEVFPEAVLKKKPKPKTKQPLKCRNLCLYWWHKFLLDEESILDFYF